MDNQRTPAAKKAKQLAKYLRSEQPDYTYLKTVWKHLRAELGIEVPKTKNRDPYIPTEEEIQRYYQAVWKARNVQDMVIIKTLLYTGMRVSELIEIKQEDVDLEQCQIHLKTEAQPRIVPFPVSFKEVLAIHMDQAKQKKTKYLFESSWKRQYSDRGIRKMMAKYAEEARLEKPLTPYQLRYFLLRWLKQQGLDDALIQPYTGHVTKPSFLGGPQPSREKAQEAYEKVMLKFPV